MKINGRTLTEWIIESDWLYKNYVDSKGYAVVISPGDKSISFTASNYYHSYNKIYGQYLPKHLVTDEEYMKFIDNFILKYKMFGVFS